MTESNSTTTPTQATATPGQETATTATPTQATTTTPAQTKATTPAQTTATTAAQATSTAATPTQATTTATPAQASWKEQKTKLKAQYSTLTDADLHYEEGKKDEMLAAVQTKLGKTKEEFETIIAEL